MAQPRFIDIVPSETSRRRNTLPLRSENSGLGLVGGGVGDLVDDKGFDGALS
jgi:hypothetical protein